MRKAELEAVQHVSIQDVVTIVLAKEFQVLTAAQKTLMVCVLACITDVTIMLAGTNYLLLTQAALQTNAAAY